MKIDFNYRFKDLNGKDIPEWPDEVEKDKDGKEVIDKDGKKVMKKYPPFTLKMACVIVLLAPELGKITCSQCRAVLVAPKELTGEEKVTRGLLATEIHKGGLVDVGTKDIELLKGLIAKEYTSLIVMQAWATLDPHEVEERKKK